MTEKDPRQNVPERKEVMLIIHELLCIYLLKCMCDDGTQMFGSFKETNPFHFICSF